MNNYYYIIGGVVILAVVYIAQNRSNRSTRSFSGGSTPVDPAAMQLQSVFIQSTLEDRKNYREALLKDELQKQQFTLGKRGIKLQEALAEIGLERVKAEEQTKQRLGELAFQTRKAELSAQKQGGFFGFLSDIGKVVAGLI